MDAAISVGNYIYVRSYNNTVMRVNKTDGSTQIIAGDSAHGNDSRKDDLLTGITGIATDGSSLYTSDVNGLAIIKALRPRLCGSGGGSGAGIRGGAAVRAQHVE